MGMNMGTNMYVCMDGWMDGEKKRLLALLLALKH